MNSFKRKMRKYRSYVNKRRKKKSRGAFLLQLFILKEMEGPGNLRISFRTRFGFKKM